MKIAREFHWEMGHRLPFHAGGCYNIHGHSYRLWVELEGEPDENGFVMDYGEMSKLVRPVLNELDHSFLCDESDEVMAAFLRTTDFKVVYVPFTTTAEHIVTWLLDRLACVFSNCSNIFAIKLRLQETEISYAEREKLLVRP
jgi:6-pyruvoyltetrahydropterin/6-carboxytetrahydropterin synthase